MVTVGRAPGGRSAEMVGRTAERARLVEVLDEVIADGSRFVLVGGDAGVGKTTVLEAFLADLGGPLADRGATVVRGQCVPLGGEGLPYAPVVGALRDLLARCGRERLLDWAGVGREALGVLLPDLATPGIDVETVRLQLVEAVGRLWERAAAEGPLVVVMEDIHWADESTRHLLRFLARALGEASVLLVATYRTDELTRRHPLRPFLAEVGRFAETVRLEVPALTRDEVAELLGRLLGHEPSHVVADLIFQRSEGVPYFVEELTRSATRGCIDMPDTLRDALNVRVLALSEPTQQVLQVAAVAGNRVDHALLEAVAGSSALELEGALREAIDAAVLTADETGYTFRHALLREVVHDDLLPGQHSRLHARYAAVLEARPELVPADTLAPTLAHHWSAAHHSDKAFRWSMRAAGAASAAFPEMLKMYERALDLWDRVPDPEQVAGSHASVLGRAARAAEDAGEDERALALAAAAVEETGPAMPVERIELLILKARLLAGLLRPGAVETLQEAYELLPSDADTRLRARVLDELAKRTMLGGDFPAGLELARTAIAAALDAGSPSGECNARVTLATGLVAIGDEAAGLAEYQRARSLARVNSRTQIRFFVNHSDALHLAGRYQAAVDEALRGVQVAADLGLARATGAMLAGNAAEPLIALGEWNRASGIIDRALELDPPMHHRAHLGLLRAWLHVWRGELDEAAALLPDFGWMIHGEQPSPQYASYAIRVDAEAALASDDPGRAWGDVQVFFEHWPTYHVAHTFEVLAAAAAAAYRLDSADGGSRRAQVAERLATVRPIAISAAWVPVVRAELSDRCPDWQEAVEALAGEPSAPAHLRPYAGLRLARHLVEQRDRVAARRTLAVAAEQALALGARLLTDRIAALGQRAGLDRSAADRPGGEPSQVSGLTPRELEVLRLIAAGRSNGEIGRALFISTKTASVHVSNILAKLRVSGRGEAAAVAHRFGL